MHVQLRKLPAIQWAQREGGEASQPSRIAMAFKQQLVVLSYLVLQSAGDANASSRLRGANSSVEGGMAKVLTNLTWSTKSGLAAKSAKQPEWTAWFSDEGWGSASCNGLISGMECSGRYCDSVRLGCDYSLGSDHVSSRWKGWFSDTSESLCDKRQSSAKGVTVMTFGSAAPLCQARWFKATAVGWDGSRTGVASKCSRKELA